MRKCTFVAFLLLILICGPALRAQYTPWLYWTLLPAQQMDEIIGEASGETAWNTILETGGYNQDRPAEEYAGTFYEAAYVLSQLKKYGLPGAEIVRYPGGQTWNGIKGELWEVEPDRRKIASYRDMTAMLASGSRTADVTAELVWVGGGTPKEIGQVETVGRIVVTEGSISTVHALACVRQGALGVIAISQSRPHFDPLQIPWRGIAGRRSDPKAEVKFGFYLPAREGAILKRRLLQREKITVHAQVEASMETYEMQNIVCRIPGTDPSAGEIIFSAHLFEGFTKQGANDNKSGSAAILEAARTLNTLISEGRLPRPRRTIRFLWGPEYSGTGLWVRDHKEIMARTLCNINMDMVGEWLSKNQAYMCLMRTSFGNPHYINDVMENYYRFVGEGNRERIQNRSTAYKVPHRIVAPSGADEPFPYAVETHYGASDHEVFNDWAVRVPGVMMIAWPDRWYHTSGDRADKADPTQLKRTVVIGAAAAYTIASADDDAAVRIAGEITSNASRRLSHQFMVGQDLLNRADAGGLMEAYESARLHVEISAANETATLASVLELARNRDAVETYIEDMQKSVSGIAKTHLAALETHMRYRAKRVGITPTMPKPSTLEKQAARIIPRATARVMEGGYRVYQKYIDEIPREIKKKFPYSRSSIGNTSELHLLIDGRRSALDIKHGLDVQYPRRTDLQAVINYLEILKTAGLIEM